MHKTNKKVNKKTRVKRKYVRRNLPAVQDPTMLAASVEEEAMIERIGNALADTYRGKVGEIEVEITNGQKRVTMTGVAAAAAHHAVFSDLVSRLDAFVTDPKAVNFILSPSARNAIRKALLGAQADIENVGE